MASSESRPFAAELDRSGSTLTAYLSGDLDLVGAPLLVEAMQGAVDESVQRVVLDLSTLTFCDSLGLRAMLTVNQQVLDRGGEVVLQDPSRTLRRMLAVTGIDTVLAVQGITEDPSGGAP
ncbi:STAS domain-containing protein [Aquihabitans sp. G128]|uniref:STAS domain-containing protein n=1 Tax=Aquihabitans sp. G128 TaxID=2849779 RepID=UPI001C22D6C5|nr:STAS domain-containing protein [Aquihabitans sp. G128]QXC62217.1 STAS domain-containing protein [Aquihabitans sp. G128]